MTDENDALLEAITAAVPPILTGLETLNFVGRHFHPPNLAAVVDSLGDVKTPITDGLGHIQAVEFPEHLQPFKDRIVEAGERLERAFTGLEEAAGGVEPMRGYRALGQATRATEALYPLAQVLPPVSRYFLETRARSDDDLVHKLLEAGSGENVGVMHANDDKGARGGFSLYVPEYYDESTACPLIVAMHGGSGNGGDFLWTWIKEARSRGAILISPTARGDTWSLMGPDVDSANIEGMVDLVRDRWNVDESKMLMTGMSDGGTFTYVSGLRDDSPFTHLAPSSASFHPLLIEGFSRERLEGLPIYLMHGALDWMFPVDVARTANTTLSAAGADVVYREIDDLSHTYPRDENPRILDWFLDGIRPDDPAPTGDS